MRQASWSLASRLTRLFAITTSVLVLVITLVSAWYVKNSAEQALGGLLHEEIDEMASEYDTQGHDADLLKSVAVEFKKNHAAIRMAWRIWRADGSTEWASVGDTDLFTHAHLSPAADLRDTVQSFSGNLRGLVKVGRADMLFGCVVDGTSRLDELYRYTAIGLTLVFVTIAIIFVVGHVLVGRVSRTLHQVAESARSVQGSDASMQVELGDAPVEIREIVAALQEMLTNVRREAERNRVFTASLAHELRSPIQNLMGETEVALMTSRDGVEYRRVLTSHLQELRDLADAVDNLVTICSQRKGHHDVTQTRESFDLAPEARLRLARETGFASACGVELRLESTGNTRLYGDREGLLRAMRNLTANAIEWSAPGSHVEVHLRGENGRVIVTVDDAGPGVPDDLKERIFEPFFRGPQAKGRRIGYGLGLAIVRAAVDSQGGAVEVSRSPQGGARFCMILPRNMNLSPTQETPT